jgi:hypothetical protein
MYNIDSDIDDTIADSNNNNKQAAQYCDNIIVT